MNFCDLTEEEIHTHEIHYKKNMIWFKIKELEKQLVEGKVSELLTYKYLLSHLLFFALINNYPGVGGDTDTFWAPWIRLIIVLVAISWGIGKTFEINRAGDNRDYFKRLISLSLISSLRTIVVFFVFAAIMSTAILVGNMWNITLIKEGLWREIWQLAGYLFLLLVYYYILISSFKRINGENLADGSRTIMELVEHR